MSRRKSTETQTHFYTTKDVAVMFGVSNTTVVNWVKDGRLSAMKTPGGHRRIPRGEVLAFARENRFPVPRELAPTVQRRRVLVVDDERDFAETVREYLVANDLEVDVESSGFAAGYHVARYKPDLILLDLLMPELDGFEVHRMLRANPETSHIPVIACTGYRAPEVDVRIAREGFDGFVEKPLKLDDLLTKIRGLIPAA
jgi:excisionase family DNA binding protein